MNTSKLHPWSVIRGVLLELSSYEVPKVIDRAGLSVDWGISEKQDYSDKMRIAAYRPRIDRAYAELSQEDGIRVAYVLTDELSTRGLGEKLDAALRAIGWRIDGGKLAPDAEPLRELFFPTQSQHDAYVEIRRILQAAKKSITVVDPYLDQTIFTLLASTLQPEMTIRLLTSKVPADFHLEAKVWRAQHSGITLDVRTTREFHDRFVVLDDFTCWHVGASIKDAGSKAFMLSCIEDDENCYALLVQLQASWQKAQI